MSTNYILSIDQSTTSTKVLLIDRDGICIYKSNILHRQFYPQPGWVEQDAEEIFQNVLRGIYDVLHHSGTTPEKIAGIAITNQTGAFVLWSRKTGRPVSPLIGWQCSRGQAAVERLSEPAIAEFYASTGTVPSGFMPAAKVRWLFDEKPELQAQAERGELAFGSVDSWLIWCLTGGESHVTDCGNACVTQLLDLYTLDWSDAALRTFSLPRAMLPKILDSDAIFGRCHVSSLPQWPIAAVMGDSNAALLSQGAFLPGSIKATYGTGVSVLLNMGSTPTPEKNGLLPGVAWKLGGVPTYVLEGTAVCAGASIGWLVDELGIIPDSAQTDALARSISGTDGVYFVSAFNGLGTPYWDTNAAACIIGMRRGVGKAHLIRAALEGVAYQITDILYAGLGPDLQTYPIYADGGMTKNTFLMQFQADITGAEIKQNNIDESSALGAAYLAGIQLGFWDDLASIPGSKQSRTVYQPMLPRHAARTLYAGWKNAIKTARGTR